MTKRIMRTFKINEISAVDRPAQAGARMTILKRDATPPAMKGIEHMTEAEVTKMIADAVTAATADLAKQLTSAQTQLKSLTPPPVKKAADPAVEPEGDDATLKAWRPYVAKAIADAVAAAKAEHDAEVTKREEALKNDEAFTTAEGAVIRKSEFGTDAAFKFAKSQQDRLEISDFSKRADEEIPHLPGATLIKAEALRAVAKLDKKLGEAITAMLKAGSAALKANMNQLGHNEIGESTALGQLEKMVAEHAAKHNVSKAVAYTKVLETSAGAELYGKAVNEKPRAA